LQGNTTLLSLSLSKCSIEFSQTEFLLLYLNQTTTLTYLDISDNRGSVLPVMQAIEKNNSLKTLDFSQFPFYVLHSLEQCFPPVHLLPAFQEIIVVVLISVSPRCARLLN